MRLLSIGAAGVKRRMLVDSRVRQYDAAPYRYGVQESVRITAHTLTVHSAEKIAERTDEAGAEEMGGSVVSPNYDTANHAHAQKIAKRSGGTERRARTRKIR